MLTSSGVRKACRAATVLARGAVPAGVLALGLAVTGCAVFAVGAAIGGGAAGVAYAKGDLQARVQADPRAVEKASLKAFETLGIRPVWSYGSATEAEVVGQTADSTKITIKAKTDATALTALSIRVGVFGDEYLSHRLYDEVRLQLPEASRALAQELKEREAPAEGGTP